MVSVSVRLVVALFLVIILTIIPIPEILRAFRPPWVLLFFLYLQLVQPRYFNIGLLFFTGLCMDVLLSTVLGEHVFALLFTSWIAAGKVRRFHFFAMMQQMLWIALFCFLYQSTLYLIDAFLGNHIHFLSVLVITILSFLLWPFFCVLLTPNDQPRNSLRSLQDKATCNYF